MWVYLIKSKCFKIIILFDNYHYSNDTTVQATFSHYKYSNFYVFRHNRSLLLHVDTSHLNPENRQRYLKPVDVISKF